MRIGVRFRRPTALPAPLPAKPTLDYQAPSGTNEDADERPRRWYEPNFRWRNNREMVLDVLRSVLGELFAWIVVIAAIVALYALFA
jgi:hypothetical protein